MGSSTTYLVEGMTCDHCVRAVRAEVTAVPGVSGVVVDLGTGEIVVAAEGPADDDAVRAAVEEAGYRLVRR